MNAPLSTGWEAAGVDEFAAILSNVDRDQERALRAYLGDAAFEQMRDSALQMGLVRGAMSKLGNVVVLHGILGGELSENSKKIWANVFRLALGEFADLGVDANGQSIDPISATGIVKKYYGQMLLNLATSGWNVQFLPYDWRLDIRDAADKLRMPLIGGFRRGRCTSLRTRWAGWWRGRRFNGIRRCGRRCRPASC